MTTAAQAAKRRRLQTAKSAPATKRPRLSCVASPPLSRADTKNNLRGKKPKGAKSSYGSTVPSLPSPFKQPSGEDSQCYEHCEHDHCRHVGGVDIQCKGPCQKWYHRACLHDYNIPNVPFMISYVFYCKQCTNLKWPGNECEWLEMSSYADLDEYCVTVLANFTYKWLVANDKDVHSDRSYEVYFDVKQICDGARKCWRNSVEKGLFDPARVTEELTLQVLAGYPSLFVRNRYNASQYALREKDLSVIGALNKDLEVLLTNRLERLQPTPLVVDEHTNNSVVLRPQVYRRFFRVELDPAVVPSSEAKVYKKYAQAQPGACGNHTVTLKNMKTNQSHAEELPALPTFACRLVHPKTVTLSPMDCDAWLKVEDNLLAVTGRGLGSSTVRATHAVANGAWYFEAKVLEHPPGSAVRIGWAQLMTRPDTSLGSQKNAYSWKSLTGEKVNDGMSQVFTDDGFGAGDVIGCLISLPDVVGRQQEPPCYFTFSDFLPTSHKNDSSLVAVDNTLFFEYQPESEDHLKKNAVPNSPSIQGSKIEFFKNGQPCGIAFEGLCSGAYYPAVSIFGHAKVQCNFGPTLAFPVCVDGDVRPMADRAEQIHVEQAVSDLIENTIALSKLF